MEHGPRHYCAISGWGLNRGLGLHWESLVSDSM